MRADGRIRVRRRRPYYGFRQLCVTKKTRSRKQTTALEREPRSWILVETIIGWDQEKRRIFFGLRMLKQSDVGSTLERFFFFFSFVLFSRPVLSTNWGLLKSYFQ